MTSPTKCDELFTPREIEQLLYTAELEAELGRVAKAARRLILAQLQPAHKRARAILHASRELAQLISKYDDGKDDATEASANEPGIDATIVSIDSIAPAASVADTAATDSP